MNSQSLVTQVFVYGTLKPGEYNYQKYCQGKTIAEIPAYTIGELYHLAPGYPAITEGNRRVEGYLLSFAGDDILKSLDILEGYSDRDASECNDYNRQLIEVYSLSGEPLAQAWGYIMSKKNIAAFGGKILNCDRWSSQRMSSSDNGTER